MENRFALLNKVTSIAVTSHPLFKNRAILDAVLAKAEHLHLKYRVFPGISGQVSVVFIQIPGQEPFSQAVQACLDMFTAGLEMRIFQKGSISPSWTPLTVAENQEEFWQWFDFLPHYPNLIDKVFAHRHKKGESFRQWALGKEDLREAMEFHKSKHKWVKAAEHAKHDNGGSLWCAGVLLTVGVPQ